MKPHMNEQTHRLTDHVGSTGERHPEKCQHCGDHRNLTRWQEHDHNDRPEHRVIVLCKACSDRMIEPHPRLYRPLNVNDPWPGCMEICIDCRLRDGVRCTSPAAKCNGGDGVMLTVADWC